MKTGMITGAACAALALIGCSDTAGPDEPAGAKGGAAQKSANNPLGLALDEQAAVDGCLTPEEQRTPVTAMSPAQRREKIGCLNARMARQIGSQLPVEVDPLTTLVEVSSEAHVLTYHYRIEGSASDLPPGAAGQLEANTRRTVCTQPQMRQTIEFGGAYAYRWADSDGRPIHAVQIESCSGA